MKRFSIYALILLIMTVVLSSGEAMALEAKVISYRGDVKVASRGGEAMKCQAGMFVENGTFLETGGNSFITLGLGENNLVNLREKSKVIVKLSDAGGIELVDGKIFALLKGLDKGNSFIIKTPCAVCGARGTGWETETDGGETTILVFDGEVFVKGIAPDGSMMGKEFITERGFGRSIKRNEPPGNKEKLSGETMANLDREAAFAANALGFLKSKDAANKHAKREEKTLNALSNRLERDDPTSRLDKVIDMPAVPVGGGGRDDDDD